MNLIAGLKSFMILSLITGVLYPLTITAVAQLGFSEKARGQFVVQNGEERGSLLIAQEFNDPRYFSGRPSANHHDPRLSGGSNLGPTSDVLRAQIGERTAQGAAGELLTASGSGLDPHISPDSARRQIERVANARHVAENHVIELNEIIDQLTESPTFGFLGEKRVNVLRLNLEIDRRGL